MNGKANSGLRTVLIFMIFILIPQGIHAALTFYSALVELDLVVLIYHFVFVSFWVGTIVLMTLSKGSIKKHTEGVGSGFNMVILTIFVNLIPNLYYLIRGYVSGIYGIIYGVLLVNMLTTLFILATVANGTKNRPLSKVTYILSSIFFGLLMIGNAYLVILLIKNLGFYVLTSQMQITFIFMEAIFITLFISSIVLAVSIKAKKDELGMN